MERKKTSTTFPFPKSHTENEVDELRGSIAKALMVMMRNSQKTVIPGAAAARHR